MVIHCRSLRGGAFETSNPCWAWGRAGLPSRGQVSPGSGLPRAQAALAHVCSTGPCGTLRHGLERVGGSLCDSLQAGAPGTHQRPCSGSSRRSLPITKPWAQMRLPPHLLGNHPLPCRLGGRERGAARGRAPLPATLTRASWPRPARSPAKPSSVGGPGPLGLDKCPLSLRTSMPAGPD